MQAKRSRFLMLHPETNLGKVLALEALFAQYVIYVKICVDLMVERKTFSLQKSAKQAFFPPAERLTSQIEKNARDHAIGIVSSWGASTYTNCIQKAITKLKKEGLIDELTAKSLYTIGKYSRQVPSGTITQEHLDQYWKILLETVRTPSVTEKIGMRLSEMTSRLEAPKNTVTVDFWLRVSSLEARKSVWLPIVGSPYVQKPGDVGKGFLARKTRGGRWRFEALETRDDDAERPVPTEKVGVDVGLNVIAATSDGRLIGSDLKPKFDALYAKIKAVRSNRMRQGLKENSPRLDCLESRLSGLTKSATGEAANKLIKAYPNHVFVVEDLDLRGCRGSKRFCFRALHQNLASKAVVEVVNPAYTSQECPSCGYVSRSNRSGVKFRCRSCGRKGHADRVGASGVLRRSEDESIGCEDQPIRVREVLRRRYRSKRNSLFGSLPTNAPRPIGQEFTTEVLSKEGIGTASNSMPNFA